MCSATSGETMSLQSALRDSGIPAELEHNLSDILKDTERIVIAPAAAVTARQIADQARTNLPTAAESLALLPGRLENQPVLAESIQRRNGGTDVGALAVVHVLDSADRRDPLHAVRSAPVRAQGVQQRTQRTADGACQRRS